MMSLPFFGAFLALLATLSGERMIALILWVVSTAVLLALFRMHATSPLNIAL